MIAFDDLEPGKAYLFRMRSPLDSLSLLAVFEKWKLRRGEEAGVWLRVLAVNGMQVDCHTPSGSPWRVGEIESIEAVEEVT